MTGLALAFFIVKTLAGTPSWAAISAAALVRELAEPLLHDLLEEDAVQLGHTCAPKGSRFRRAQRLLQVQMLPVGSSIPVSHGEPAGPLRGPARSAQVCRLNQMLPGPFEKLWPWPDTVTLFPAFVIAMAS